MKNQLLIFIIFCSYFLNAQSINFNSINSQNILNMIDKPVLSSENSSKTAVIQLGNNNNAMVNDRSKKSDLVIRQTGNFNTTLLNNANPDLENKQKVNIEGSNNYIDITGNNGNSKELQINLKSNDKMIFVRHY